MTFLLPFMLRVNKQPQPQLITERGRIEVSSELSALYLERPGVAELPKLQEAAFTGVNAVSHTQELCYLVAAYF